MKLPHVDLKEDTIGWNISSTLKLLAVALTGWIIWYSGYMWRDIIEKDTDVDDIRKAVNRIDKKQNEIINLLKQE